MEKPELKTDIMLPLKVHSIQRFGATLKFYYEINCLFFGGKNNLNGEHSQQTRLFKIDFY